jgi:hypothetical protein
LRHDSLMGYARKTLGLKTVQELASVEGFFLWGCPYCDTSHIVQAVDLRNDGKGNMPLADVRFQCRRCTRWESVVMPCLIPYDWVLSKLVQRELPL